MNVSQIISLVFRAVALAMAVSAIVLSIVGTTDVDTLLTLLSIGMVTLALDALDKVDEEEKTA